MPYVPTINQYATIAQLQAVMSPQALQHPVLTDTVKNEQLARASEEIDGYLREQFSVPLAAWSGDIVQRTCDIAAYRLICLRGFNPEKDGLYKDNYDYAIKWLLRVAQNLVTPTLVDGSSGATVGSPAPSAQPSAYSPSALNATGGYTRGSR